MTVVNARRSAQVAQKFMSHIKIRGAEWVTRGKHPTDSPKMLRQNRTKFSRLRPTLTFSNSEYLQVPHQIFRTNSHIYVPV
jgi:hypothetical protein